MIFIAGISIALFISALLLVKKDKSKSDIFLFIWMLLMAAHLAIFYLFYTEEIFNHSWLLGIGFPLPLLHGVLLYYYVSSVTNQFPKKKLATYFHLLPTVLTYLYLIPFFLLSPEEKIKIFKNEGLGYETFQMVLLLSVSLSGIIYVLWSSRLLIKHKKQIRSQFSDLEEIDLIWLQFLTAGLGVIWCVVIFTQNDSLIFIGVSVFVILIGFFGVQQKNIFNNQKSIPEKIKQSISEETTINHKNEEFKKKYLNSGLSDEMKEDLNNRLDKIITQEKIYKDSNLSLKDLADKLQTHPNYLSQIINEKMGVNFYDYVNTFRIEEFKRLIAIPENQQFTLMATAYDCGFNSKSSFNRYFKKKTNQTPSQYLKSLQQS